MSRFGIDFAWHDGYDTTVLKADGVTFVARYYAAIKDSKELNLTEAQILSSGGIDIVTVYESTASRVEGGSAAGASDINSAVAQAKAAGQPAGSGLYYAVDENTTVGPHITGYAQEWTRGAHANGYRSGVYGRNVILDQLFAAKLVDLGWQTYAWSGGRVSPHAALYQYSNGHTVGGIPCDYDRSLTDDFGQWRIGAPPPAPGNRFTGYPTLRLGAHDSKTGPVLVGYDPKLPVHSLQNALNILLRHESKTDPARLTVDGEFGNVTEEAVRTFQQLNYRVLTVDGAVGPQTWAVAAFELSVMHR